MSRPSPLRLLVLLILVVACPAPAGAGCDTSPAGATAGAREYVCATPNKLKYYDGSSWLDFPISGTGTQCGVVAGSTAGTLKYGNTPAHPSAEHTFEYYDDALTCHKLACASICTMSAWSTAPQTEMTCVDGGASLQLNAQFGHAVGVSGTVAVVGEWVRTVSGHAQAGSVYLYDISNPASPVWKTTIADPPAAASELFGGAVAISGSIAVIAARGTTSTQGAAYVYDLTDPASPVLKATIADPAATSGDLFGYSVAVDGDTALIVSYGNNK